MSEKKEEREEQLGNALLKVALGYQIAEVTEEYAEVNGELKLTKRKKTKKDVPPDLKAVQLLLSNECGEYSEWTEEELSAEKERLLSLLKSESEKAEKKKKVGGRVATKTKKSRSATKKKRKTVTKKTVKETE